ncbi:MAG: HEAT repeat domain-containing protein, partial [Armatimonadota bacterium]
MRRSVEALVRDLDSPNPRVRETAAHALGTLGIGARGVVPALIERLADENGFVRDEAWRSLIKLGKPAARALAECLGDKNRRTRYMAAEALAMIGPSAVPVLTKQLQGKDPLVWTMAAWSLGRMGKEARGGVRALVQRLSDEDAQVRDAVLGALANIGAPAVAALTAELRARNPVVRRLAATALGQIAAAAAAPELAQQLEAARAPLALRQASCARVVAALLARLSDEDEGVRTAAAKALGKVGAPAVEPLITRLQHPEALIRKHAAQALSSMGEVAALAVPALVQCLEDLDDSVREEAALALDT